MIRVLVVSDNLKLVLHLQAQVCGNTIKDIAHFEFCYSAANKNPEMLIKQGMGAIDLSSDEVCERVISHYDLVLSIHCKQIFPGTLVKAVACINFHPGFNPYNRGWYPQVFSILNQQPIGATIHLMDEMVDHGRVIAQERIEILPTDTSLSVYNRVIELEKKLISENLEVILLGRYEACVPSSDGNYNSIQDFQRVCRLDMSSMGTLREHINLLRALSHGDFKNAYFVEGERKIYVSVNLSD